MLNGLLLLVALLLPIWQQRSKVWTDRTDLRKIGLKAGHFRPQCEHFEYCAFVNLQPSSVVSRFQSQLSKKFGQIACVPHGSYRRASQLHPAFAECIRRLFGLPTRLSMTAIREHTEMQQVAARLSKETGTTVKLPSYKQVRTAVQHLKMDPDLMAMREGAKSVGKCRTKWAGLALRRKHLPSHVSTERNMPGKTVPHPGRQQGRL